MDDAFLHDLVADAAQYLCSLSKEGAFRIPDADPVCDSGAINGILELIWDVSLSSSAAEAMGDLGCTELLWGIAFQSGDDRIQELCLGALANMCLQSACCCRLLALPDSAIACVALCVPSAGLDVGSGSYVQALRLSRVILGEHAAAPQRGALLGPFFNSTVCRQVAALLPKGRLQRDGELQAALIDLVAYILECAPECDVFAQISDNFIEAGVFAAALQAAQGAFSDVARIARLLSLCQNHARVMNLYDQIDTGCVMSACVAMLTQPSLSCCSTGIVRSLCMPARIEKMTHHYSDHPCEFAAGWSCDWAAVAREPCLHGRFFWMRPFIIQGMRSGRGRW